MGGIVTIRILIRIGETKRETGPLPLFRLRSAFRTQAAVHFYHRQSSVRSGFRIAFHHTLRRIYLLACGQQADASIRLSGTFGGVSDPNSFSSLISIGLSKVLIFYFHADSLPYEWVCFFTGGLFTGCKHRTDYINKEKVQQMQAVSAYFLRKFVKVVSVRLEIIFIYL
ncbi:hypothetical protein [Allobaculum sp. Allo2]|uniref:hypothetical protein n=1 Tax=Allobaculum sp. Allo2 TaxID=2853432 RepID=UPI001F60C965|nr:hypothetical protein [Allobaculum sp. Allo2]UNT93804.1 hypothetical protein KWG61_03510 [Allobaculum sp. Allo2]